jgi:acetyl esterase/lipase
MKYRSRFKKTVVAFVPLLIAAEAIAQAPALGSTSRGQSAANPPGATNPANPARRGGPGGFAVGRAAPLPAGVRADRNIPYVENGHRNQVLDLFLPEQPSEKPRPLMIWIHGAGHEGPEFRNAESRRLIEDFLSRTLKSGK